MKIAIIGGGISGNVVARHLQEKHDITLFEANAYLGGHTHTHDIEVAGERISVDSGFIVFNDWTYPNFLSLLAELGVRTQKTEMSFSVRCEHTGLEYSGTNINTLFSQRRNLFRPEFHKMILEILRFNREAPDLLKHQDNEIALGDFLEKGRFSHAFVNHYIVPMGAAIWSTNPKSMLAFPALFFVRFLKNHGLMSITDRPQWRVVSGGSRKYLDAMSATYKDSIRLNTPVISIRRQADKVFLRSTEGGWETFDHVFLACHSDQALAMLENPTLPERQVLGALPYQRNEAVLHTDTRLMPRQRRAWAAWNYHLSVRDSDAVAVTYNMNILQGFNCRETLLVTLNSRQSIDPARIIKTIHYDHPLFTLEGAAAQQRHHELNGTLNTWYCGAYWRNGFHEDGVVSALSALETFNTYHESKQLPLRRAG